MDFAVTVIVLVVAGACIGVCSGMLGIGGGMLVIPLLRLVMGLDAVVATATSLFTIAFTSVSGAITHIRMKTCIPLLGVALGIGGGITSSLGVYLSHISPAWAIMLAAAIIILYSATTMLRKAIKMPKGAGKGSGKKPRGTAQQMAKSRKANAGATSSQGVVEHTLVVTPKVFAQGVLIGMCAGIAAGYVGVGGGFLMVPLMLSVFKLTMREASSTSLVAMVILAIPGIIGHAVFGHIDYLAGVALVVGTIPGAVLGARLSRKVPERALRFGFSAFLAVAAVLLVLKETGIFG